jgi:hypothetical protein
MAYKNKNNKTLECKTCGEQCLRRSPFQSYCVECGKKRRRAYKTQHEKDRMKNPKFLEKYNKWRKDWQIRNRDKLSKEVRERAQKAKSIVYENYGGKCACCGESIKEFLSIDHIQNNGAEWRRNNKSRTSGGNFYRWIIKNDFPKDLQLLCMNCNFAKNRHKGECPHQTCFRALQGV